ncbi:replication factor C large subunit [Candidatus Pyrohabitans sp.]
MKTWVEKYRPRTLKEVAGNPRAIAALLSWVREWKTGTPRKRALLLYGPPGSGKTSAAYALARDLNYDYIELNASDWRTRDVINRIVGSASRFGTLDPAREKKVIILDEVDGIHGRAEYGGLAALKKLITGSRHPIILIANDPWKLPPEFRGLTQMVEFKRINQRTVLRVLKEICRREGIAAEEKVLKIIAANSNGDLRSAINDLQALAEGRRKLTLKDAELLTMRDVEIKIFDTLVRILKTESIERAREAVRESGEDPDTILKWLAENLPLEYRDAQDLARAYNYLSRADVFQGRILRRQDWGLMSYMIDLMSAGVALAKKRKYPGYTRYQYPKIFAMYAQTRGERQSLDALAGKLQGKRDAHTKIHASRRVIKEQFIPMLRHVMKHAPEMAALAASELELELKEIKLLAEDEKLAQEIARRAEEITKERMRRLAKGDRTKQVSLWEF